MRLTPRRALLICLALGACVYTAFSTPLGGDYPGPTCRGCDFAGPPIQALAAGHVDQFFTTQPFMGSVTLLARTPVVAIARAAGASQLWQYRLGCLLCLLLAAGLVGFLVVLARRRGRGMLIQAILVALLLAGPLTAKALSWGHPEEVVGGLLCVVAVLLAGQRRTVLAAIALGLALGTKQWALLAVLPTLIVTAPGQRWRLLGVTAGVAALFVAPMFIGDPGRFLYQNLHAGLVLSGSKLSNVSPTNIWFPYSTHIAVSISPGYAGLNYQIPASLAELSHPLAMLLGLGLPLLYWRQRAVRLGERDAADALLVLALVFLIRCMLDPLTISYHHMPFFVALAAWETMRRKGLPLVSLGSAAAIYAMGRWVAPTGNSELFNEVYLAWALSVTAYLSLRAYLPGWRGLRPARPLGDAPTLQPAS